MEETGTERENVKKPRSGIVSALLVLASLAIGFAAGRFGSTRQPAAEAEETGPVYLTSEIRSYQNGATEPDSVTKYAYDDCGRILYSREERNGVPGAHCEYTYDESGNCTSLMEYNEDGQLTWEMESTYDSEGREQTFRSCGIDGVATVHEYTYDEDGEIAETICRNDAGEIESRTERAIVKNADSSYMLEETVWEGDTGGTRTVYVYDPNDNLTRSETYYRDGTSEVWEYDYIILPASVGEGNG